MLDVKSRTYIMSNLLHATTVRSVLRTPADAAIHNLPTRRADISQARRADISQSCFAASLAVGAVAQ